MKQNKGDKLSSYKAIAPISENTRWEKWVIEWNKKDKLFNYRALVPIFENIKWEK